jgi:hypothetical protein
VSYFTSFIGAIFSAWGENTTDPLSAHDSQQLIADSTLNILYHRQEQFELDSAASRSISLANYTSSEWTFMVMKVVGKAYFNIAALDTDGVTVISSKIPAYGTSVLPGIAIFSSYNVTSVSVVSSQDDTVIELYAAISCADDDTRLL